MGQNTTGSIGSIAKPGVGACRHLERFAGPGLDGLVFMGPKGSRRRRSNFRESRVDARGAAGLPGLHLHDMCPTPGARWLPRLPRLPRLARACAS
jgi:hypothetical protein